MTKKKVIVIVGPTAAGKTRFAIKLAERIRGEIISADSMQVYKGMDILSQAPTKPERRKIPHYLISFLKPSEEYSAAKFAKRATKIIKSIMKRGKVPIVVGGSGLYVKALVDGIFLSKGKNRAFRAKLERVAREKGPEALHGKLAALDPAAASKIHKNDKKRIIRAIEICELEGTTKTKLEKNTKGIKEEYDIRILGLRVAREDLYRRINQRVDFMFKKGIVEEVKKVLKQKPSLTAKQALGISQVEKYIEGTYNIEEAKDALKRYTRRFAKRQLTWFRRDQRIEWLDVNGKSITCNVKIKE